MALDPVCGMTVDPAKAAGEFDYKGTRYYFCSKHCVHAFGTDPERYLSKKADGVHARPRHAQRGVRRARAPRARSRARPRRQSAVAVAAQNKRTTVLSTVIVAEDSVGRGRSYARNRAACRCASLLLDQLEVSKCS